ncbi:MAG TPA: hypothetical protein VMI92_06100 [Steroidobacteraceae bacterium]|nr:hypothetical protein [Steroidobacteraceae bacterium]
MPSLPRHWSAAALVLLTLTAVALCVSTYHIFGNIWDEPEHIAAGLVLIDKGDYIYDNQHPPLARMAAAIGPYLAGARPKGHAGPSGEIEGRDVLYGSSASYDTLLTLARIGMLPFLVVLLVATWFWVRRWYGDAMAALTVLLCVSTPVILGHAGIVALDVPVSGLTILSLFLLLRWFELPSLGRTLALGASCGLAIATKLSAVPFIAIAALTLIGIRLCWLRSRPIVAWQLLRRGSEVALMLLLVVLITVGVYGDKRVLLTTPDHASNKALNLIAGRSGWLHDQLYDFAARVPLPIGIEKVPLNFLGVEWHNQVGHLSFLLGETQRYGWWYFYPVALYYKTPLPLLLLGLAGLAWLGISGWRERNLYKLAPTACFVSILVFCCAYSHINIGVRHVLVLYPLLALGAAWAAIRLWQRRELWIKTAVAVLLAWQVSTIVTAYPDYLAYFNFTAGAHPERILVDSDLDWGQDLRRLTKVLAARKVPEVYIGYMGTADLNREALPPWHALVPGQPVHGWVAIDMLSLKEKRAGYSWLSNYQPVQRVGMSMDLYHIP